MTSFSKSPRFLVGAFAAWLAITPTRAADPLATWHLRTSRTTEDLDGVAYGNGRFVAVGDDGVIVSSADGSFWTRETSKTSLDLDQVTFAQGLFVVLGRGGALLTSADGQNWTPQIYRLGSGPLKLIHDGQRFVLIKVGGGLNVSTNAVDWTVAGDVPNTADVGGIAYGNGRYVEVGYKKSINTAPDIFSAPDLQTWIPHAVTVNENLMDAFYASGLFFAFGQEGTLFTSPDGQEWTLRDSTTTGFIWDMATDGQQMVAASQWGRLLVSGNGLDWTYYETEVTGHLKAVTFGAQTFVAVGWDGAIVQSDPIPVVPPPELLVSQPAWSGTAFSFQFNGVVGQSYSVVGSTNGQQWLLVKPVTCTQTPMPVSHDGPSGDRLLYRVTQP